MGLAHLHAQMSIHRVSDSQMVRRILCKYRFYRMSNVEIFFLQETVKRSWETLEYQRS